MKLRNLESFLTSKLSEGNMKAIRGGGASSVESFEQMGEPTGGGSFCSSLSSTGCVGYTSDVKMHYTDAWGRTTYKTTNYGVSESNLKC